MLNFTWGSDPEFMIVENNQLKSAIGILPAKENSKKIAGHEFFYDNVLAEIALKPGNNKNEVIHNVEEGLKTLADLIYPAKFKIQSSANYPVNELTCEKSQIAGCNPEWGVYSFKVIEPPKQFIELNDGSWRFKAPFRTAGGHIHLGSNILDQLSIFNCIRMMDLFISVPSILFDTDPTSKIRRKAYGVAGSHRIVKDQEFRFEYRPLSNFWFSSPEYVELIYELCEFVLTFVKNKGHELFWKTDLKQLEIDPTKAHTCFGYSITDIKKCINTCNKKQAVEFMKIVKKFLPNKIYLKIDKLIGKNLPDPYKEWNIYV